jgi:hypothetical protein
LPWASTKEFPCSCPDVVLEESLAKVLPLRWAWFDRHVGARTPLFELGDRDLAALLYRPSELGGAACHPTKRLAERKTAIGGQVERGPMKKLEAIGTAA